MRSTSSGVVLSTFVVIVFASVAQISCCKSYTDYKLISVSTSDVGNFNKLESKWGSQLDFLDDVYEASTPARLVIHKNQEEELTKFLAETGFEHKILIENLETAIDEERQQNAEKRRLYQEENRSTATDFALDHFLDYDEIMEYVQKVAQEYSDIVTVHYLKDSLQGRKIVNIEITAPGNKEPRPIIFIDSTIHAREWAAPMTILHLIRELTENYAEHEEMLELVRFFIVPLVNPDGYQYTHTTDRLWRKNLRGYSEDAECFGVDCNRNYDHKWAEGETENICSIIYAGTEAFSEVETQNVRDIIEGYAPKIILYISTHTYGGYMMYPFSSSTSSLPENHEEQDQVGRLFARTVKESFGTEYKVGNGANLLSIAVGTSKDWAYPKVRLSYTLELPPGDGNTGFEISFDKIKNLGKETVDGFIELANFIADNYDFADWK